MRPTLAARAARSGGVVTRGDALACGYTPDEIRRSTRPDGPWVAVRRGVYAPRMLWTNLDDTGRYVLEVRAAMLAGSADAIASHQSAAALLGLPLRRAWLTTIHTTRPGVQGSRRERGVQVHPAGVDATDVVECDGVRLTSPARTAVDIGRDRGYEDGLVAADAVLRSGVSRDDLGRVLTGMEHWPGVSAARAVVADADGGAESVGETLARIAVLELGLGRPETQFEVREGGRFARVDLRLGPLLIEFDGKVKYLPVDAGGVSDRAATETLWREKQREDWLRSLGFTVVRIIWDDLMGVERRRTQARLRSLHRSALASAHGRALAG